MTLEDWIGSVISLFGGIALLAFFNRAEKNEREQQAQQTPQEKEEEDEEDPWSEFIKFKDEFKVKSAPPPYVHKASPHPAKIKKIPKKPRHIVDESDELNSNRPVLKSSRVRRLNPIPPIHGEFIDRSPKVRKIVKDLKQLKDLVICREIMERPNKDY